MQLVGQALAEYNAAVQCIGVATWGVVYGRDQMQGHRGDVHELRREFENCPPVCGSNARPAAEPNACRQRRRHA